MGRNEEFFAYQRLYDESRVGLGIFLRDSLDWRLFAYQRALSTEGFV